MMRSEEKYSKTYKPYKYFNYHDPNSISMQSSIKWLLFILTAATIFLVGVLAGRNVPAKTDENLDTDLFHTKVSDSFISTPPDIPIFSHDDNFNQVSDLSSEEGTTNVRSSLETVMLPDEPNSKGKKCCQEIDQIECLACKLGKTRERTCLLYPKTLGCERYMPLLQSDSYLELRANEVLIIEPASAKELDDLNRMTFSMLLFMGDIGDESEANIFRTDDILISILRQDRTNYLKLSLFNGKMVFQSEDNFVNDQWIHFGFTLGFTPSKFDSVDAYMNGHRIRLRKLKPPTSSLRGTDSDDEDSGTSNELTAKWMIGPLNGRVNDIRLYSGIFSGVLLWPKAVSNFEIVPGFLSGTGEFDSSREVLKTLDSFLIFHFVFEQKNKQVDDENKQEFYRSQVRDLMTAKTIYLDNLYPTKAGPTATNPSSTVASSETPNGEINIDTEESDLPNPLISHPENQKEKSFANFKEFENFILNSVTIEELKAGNFKDVTHPDVLAYSNEYGKFFKSLSKNAMIHAYSNYEQHAFGSDELLPISGRGRENWGGRAVTMVDSLDTLWLMDMKDEFFRARDWIRDNLKVDKNIFVSFFETTIRDLGGLLSAYYLSEDKVFLEKAAEIGDKLFSTFRHDPLPLGQVNLATGQTKSAGWLRRKVLLAEVGTCQLEFAALSSLTGKNEYKEKSFAVVRKVQETTRNEDGLFPIYIDSTTAQDVSGTVTFGAMGDSFYEYLLKTWVQSNFRESDFRTWYDRAMDGAFKHLLQKTNPNGYSFIADYQIKNKNVNRKMDHLVCFFPGMLALGAYHAPKGRNTARDLIVAKQVMYTCVQMYLSTATGLPPEFMENRGTVNDIEISAKATHYLLRPEMMESLFLLHYVTRHPIYRIWGNQVMQNIDKYQRTEYGYGAFPDVRNVNAKPNDSMESFFLAETLKYHYLLQSEVDLLSLDEWVFNTEAHPLKILK